MNSRVLLVVALLAALGLAHAGGKGKPSPKPKPAPKQNVQEWCDKSTPPKCGNWANDKKVCSNTCANGGTCSLKPATGKAKAGAAAGQCCTCKAQFDSKECVCGGTTGATATYCSSATPAASNTCASCQTAICDSACAAGLVDATGSYTYDGQLTLTDPLAASCLQTTYTCPACTDPCSGCLMTTDPATAMYCTTGACQTCQFAVCSAVCNFNINNDPDIDITVNYDYVPGGPIQVETDAAACPGGSYAPCNTVC